MKWRAGGTWKQRGHYLVLANASDRRDVAWTKQRARRALAAAAMLPDLAPVGGISRSGHTLTIDFKPTSGSIQEPEQRLAPYIDWVTRFGSLDEPEPASDVLVDPAEPVVFGRYWRDWESAKNADAPTRQACIDRVVAAVAAELARPVDASLGGPPPSIRPELRYAEGQVVIDTRPVTARGFLWSVLLHEVLLEPDTGRCSFPGCDETFPLATGKRGRPPRYCPAHRSKTDHKRAERMRQAFRALRPSDLEELLEGGI